MIRKWLLLVVCVALGGGAAAFFLAPERANPLTVHSARVGDVRVELGSDSAAVASRMTELARARVERNVALRIDGSEAASVRFSTLGFRVDRAAIERTASALTDPASTVRRRAEQKHGEPSVGVAVARDQGAMIATLLAFKEDHDHPSTDARMDPATHEITKEIEGRRIDVFATARAVEAAFEDGKDEAQVVSVVEKPHRTRADLEGLRFDEVLGYFETKYARDLLHEARTFNLRTASGKLDGYVLLPGDVFDFNAVVGPRTEAMGYKIAPVIAQGELVDGIGGGTCQVAGTLHGAAFFAGLEIMERKPHTRPSFYIKMGMDAAVAYPAITLKIKNTLPFPVSFHETVKDGVVRAEILGQKRTRDVTFFRRIDEATPFREKNVDDASIPKGERVLSQRGVPGFRVTRYRIVRDGAFAVRERVGDQYPSVTQIWKVGSGDADAKWKPKDDDHPEYVADQYLSVSQGPSVVSHRALPEPGGATLESRIPGKYGSYGWMVRDGFTTAWSRDKENARKVDDSRPD